MNPNLSTKLSLATAWFLGAFAAAAFAGPSTQFSNRPATPAQTGASATAGCPASKTTDIRVAASRGPAGKSTTEWTAVGATHECTKCQGGVGTTKSGTADTMVRDAAMCAPRACCVSTTK